RVLVDDIKDCYVVLGEVHNRWKPVPGRIKDYIAVPKANGYQSLHTTLLTPSGMPFEVQIRTHEMHKVCEYGIAAHWMYKNKTTKASDLDKKLTFLRQMIEENAETLDTSTFLSIAKSDLYANDIFVFTPKNKVIELTEKSTPIDFAYALHTDIGNQCVGAKVNGKMVPLTSKLSTGDVVEIVTSSTSKGPSRDWLKIAQTPSARTKIRSYFKKQTKEDNVKIGKEMLDIEAKRTGISFNSLLQSENVNQKILQMHNFLSLEDTYAAVGYGGVTSTHIVNQFISELKAEERKKFKEVNGLSKIKHSAQCGVKVKGIDGLPIRLAGCCNPLPSDDIVGFVSVGKGIVVHRADCYNIRSQQSSGDRLVKVMWADYEDKLYNTIIYIKALDAPNLLNKITTELSSIKNVSLTAVNAKATNSQATITLTVVIPDKKQVTDIINKLSQIDGVQSVFRK
ncbi:MAG: bifunctional (p)ppGpp synthetase/guanosine-3',5'-bis(diphosphate) 3'-pyrophosphohydrolase, partial [Clostridia bacterium]|nr:bifunctional (p)ppGpp synthetase/guanosine-3',5'-bis(diphosphate) 3'-pyrophosphohydrolase [Clostridia bacterium]